MATQTEPQRRTAARKAAATRKRNQTARSARSTQASARRTASSAERTAESGAGFAGTRVEALASQAERAVLIPVGAALVARENLVEAAKPYTRRESAERELSKLQREVGADLRRYERRGVTARNRLQREIKRARTKGERQVHRVQDQIGVQA